MHYNHCHRAAANVQLNIITYLLTYSMVQSPSWEANWFAASQEIPRISRNPKVHYRTHKRLQQASRMWVLLNKVFYWEELLAPRPTPKLEDHPSSAVRDWLFNFFAATLLIGGHRATAHVQLNIIIIINQYILGT